MSQKINLSKLNGDLLRRRAAAEARGRNADGGPAHRGQALTEGGAVALITDLEKITERSKRFRAALEIWAKTQPKFQKCAKHGHPCPVDMDESSRESWKKKAHVLVFNLCPYCDAEKLASELVQRMYKSGVPRDLLHATLDNWEPRTNGDRSNLKDCKEWLAIGKGFLGMCGPSGTGKSHLSAALFRSAGARGRFITHKQLLDGLRRHYGGGPDVVEQCKAAKFLVLDEMGVSGGGKDEWPMLHDLISHRYGEMLPTVLNFNLPWEEVKELLGIRVADRFEMCMYKVLAFAGTSMRKALRTRYLGAGAK